MFKLRSLLGTAPSPKKAPEPKTYSLMVDMRHRINAQVSFTFVYLELAKANGRIAGDAKYISDIVGGTIVTARNIGVLVPLGRQNSVYEKLEQLAAAPFQSDLRVGYSSFPGNSGEEGRALRDILVEAQNYKAHRKYDGKPAGPSALGEKALECA